MQFDSKPVHAGHKSYIKVISVICSFTILLSVFAIGLTGVSAAAGGTVKTTAALNLRSGAGASYSSVCLMEKGWNVTLLSDSAKGWVKVKAQNGKTGYCSTDFISVKDGLDGMKVTARTTDYLNLRSGAGTGYSSLEVLSDGADAAVLDNTDIVWIKVKAKSGKTGYISRDYATVNVTLSKDEDDVGGSVDDEPTKSNTAHPGWFEDSIADNIVGGDSSNNIYNGNLYLSDTALTLEEGESRVLTAFLSSAAGAQAAVTWKSSNTSAVSVTAAGQLRALGKGISTITATLKGSGKTAACKVTVTGQKTQSVSLSPSSVTLSKGGSKILLASTTPPGGNIGWSTSSPTVASVNSAGLVTALSAGTAVITAKAADGGGAYASCVVTVTNSQKVQSIALNNYTLNWPVGKSGTYKAVCTPDNASNKNVTWKSSNTSVAAVSSSGVLRAVAPGTATITCTAADGGGAQAVSRVTVYQPVTSIVLNNTSLCWSIGKTGYFKAAVSPDNATNKNVTWKSSNTSVATVTSGGLLTAVGAGTATITCTAADGSGVTAKCTVTVAPQPVTGITLNNTSLDWKISRTGYFKASITPDNASNKRVTWKSSNTGVATVSSDGLLTAVGAGTATIKCTAADGSGVTAKCTVKVSAQLVTGITLNNYSLDWAVGKTGYFKAAVTPDDATNKRVTWKSSNTGVATVSSDGMLTAVGAGTATITCAAADGSGVTAKCTVKVSADSIGSILLTSTASSIYTGNHAYIKAVTTPANQKVSYTSSNTSVATVTQSGVVTGVSAGKAVITVKDPNSPVKNTYTITVVSSSGGVSLSNTTASVPADKTFYLKSYTSGTSFSSSDTAVASVSSRGYIFAKKQGVAIITASINGRSKTCAVTVTAAAPVRFAYTSPNSAALGDTVSFYAITDKTRDGAKFNFTCNGKAYSVAATSKTTDASGSHYIWKGSIKFNYSGTFAVTTYTSKNGVWSTCTDGKTSVFVSNVSSANTVSFSQRRASDGLLRLNADYEGFLSSVTDDPLVSDAPTLGYGKVVTAGEQFYNNISKDEAYAYLVQTMNGSSYTNAVNNFMSSNNVKFNQRQFDALVMMVYNLGAGVLGDSDVKRVLLDCVESGSTAPTGSTAYVNSSDGLMLRSGPGTGYNIITVMTYNTKVTVVEKTTSSWYKVKLSDGTAGYCASEYLTFASTSVRNLNLVNRDAVIGELIQWHHAGGQCVWGLLYRRIDELEVFFYGDYTRDGSSNKYNMKYRWNC